MTPDAPHADPAPTQRAAGLDGLEVAHRLLLTVTVLAVVGTVLGLVLVQRVGVTYRDGLEVASDGAAVAALSVDQASSVVDEVGTLAAAVSVAIDEAEDVLVASADSLDAIGEAMGENVADSIEGVAEIANGLAGLIEAIERFIPGNSDSLAESLRKVSDGLEPAPEQLRTLATELALTADQLRAASVALQPIGNQVDSLATSIADSQAALTEVQRLAAQVEERSQAALDRSSLDLMLLRLLILVLGVGSAVAFFAASRAVRSLQLA